VISLRLVLKKYLLLNWGVSLRCYKRCIVISLYQGLLGIPLHGWKD